MAMQTVLTSFQGYHLWVTGEYSGSREFTIPMTNFSGFVSIVLRIVSHNHVKMIGMEWKPGSGPEYRRYLPAFIDLEAGRSDGVNDGELPSYALFQDLNTDKLATGNVHYVYQVHPETPTAVPLPRDETDHHDGLKIRFHADADGADPDLVFDLYVYHTELS